VADDPRREARATWLRVLKGNNGLGWGQYVGDYRGSYYHLLNVSDEANVIAEMICAKRDLWKQNQAAAIAQTVQLMLDDIDVAKQPSKGHGNDRKHQ